ncbi:PDZ domain-containing protein [Luteimonas vadosa]
MRTTKSTTLLAATLSVLLPVSAAHAQAPAPATGDDKELAAAREDLRRAAARVSELARKRGGDVDVRVERRVERKPMIGILMTPDEQGGVRISGVTPDSAAAKAGLRSGDRLVSIAGTRILGSDGKLRVDNARKLLRGMEAGKPLRLGYLRDGREAAVNVTPKMDDQVFVWRDDGNSDGALDGPMFIARDHDGDIDIETVLAERSPGVAPQIRREIVRIGPDGKCKGKDCDAPRLLSALRWNGLNLATVDARLGRYFGTDRGVLVLSTGELDGLQAGDVIQRIEGKAVSSPREVMDALRGKPDNARVAVTYLRDRKPATSQLTVPRTLHALPPLPPAPPSPPRAPKPPKNAPPPPPPAPTTMLDEAMPGPSLAA